MTIAAHFEIIYSQILDAESKIVSPLPDFAQDIDHLLKLYRLMTLVRIFDTKAINLQRTGKLGTYPSILGQEAVSVAVGAAMRATDILCPYYRDVGAQLQRGVTMQEILGFWGGDERSNHYQHNAEDFPMCVPIATQCLHAVGVATAVKYRQQSRAVVCMCGDGATSQGDFYEAINLAGVWHLPIVFVVSNNQWAISVPRDSQTAAQTIAQKAVAAGINGGQVDGNDVIAVQHVVNQALLKARMDGGPTLIEAITYRLHDHTTADDANRYRDKHEVEQAWKKEPLMRVRQYLIDAGHWSHQQEQALIEEYTHLVEQAAQDYQAIEPEPATAIVDYLYAKLPAALNEQRELLVKYSTLDKDCHG